MIFYEQDMHDIKEFEDKYDTVKLNDLTVMTGDYENTMGGIRPHWEGVIHQTEEFKEHCESPKGKFSAVNGAVSSYDLGLRRHVMKYICYAVNQGIKILFLTNDDKQIKELNNLILLANDFPEKDEWLKENKLYRKEWSIDHKRVSAYEHVSECVDINFNPFKERSTNVLFSPLKVDKLGFSVPYMDWHINDIRSISLDLDSYLE